MLKIWHHPSYKGHFLLFVQRKVFVRLEVHDRFWKFSEVFGSFAEL